MISLEANLEAIDYVKAAIETLDLIEFFLLRLHPTQQIGKIKPIFQAIIERSTLGPKSSSPKEFIDVLRSPHSTSIQDVYSPTNYWKGVRETSIFMRTQWDELKDIPSFLTLLREKRDYFSLHIDPDALSPLEHIKDRFFSRDKFKELFGIQDPLLDA